MDSWAPTDLVLLQTFYEVGRAGSVTAAARALGRTQPAVSHRLRALERELGVALFEKVGRKLRLTDHGRRLQVECTDIMERSRRIRERVRDKEGVVEGRVAIGTLPTVAAHLLVPVMNRLLSEHPGVALRLKFGYATTLRECLRTGEIDLAVVIGELETDGVEVEPLGDITLSAVMPPEAAAGLSGTAPLDVLRGQRYLAFGGEKDPTFDLVERYARANELIDVQTPCIPHIETLRGLAAAGAGYAILPSYTVRHDHERGRVVALTPEGLEGCVPLLLVERADRTRTSAQQTVRDALRGVDP